VVALTSVNGWRAVPAEVRPVPRLNLSRCVSCTNPCTNMVSNLRGLRDLNHTDDTKRDALESSTTWFDGQRSLKSDVSFWRESVVVNQKRTFRRLHGDLMPTYPSCKYTQREDL